MVQYIIKNCLFHKDNQCLEDLYPQNFKEEDLNEEIFSARRVTEHFHYKMVRCKKTGLVFSREILHEDVLERLYSGSKVTFNEYTNVIREDYWKPLSKYVSMIKKNAALEIGCSNGFFIEELLAQGFQDVMGCEPSREAKEQASPLIKDKIHSGFFNKELYPDNSFDLICIFQTIDHFSDPLDILETCYAKLRKGGVLYAILHNVDALQAKILGEKSPIIDVEHIYLFNPLSIQLAVEQVGFKTVECFPVKNSYPMKYWMKHVPVFFPKVLSSILSSIGLNNLRIPVRAGNMGIVAQKPI
jgi:SAM-dependent methyltransferase